MFSPLSCVPGVLLYYFIVNTYLSHCTCGAVLYYSIRHTVYVSTTAPHPNPAHMTIHVRVSFLSCVPGAVLYYSIVNTYLSPVHHHRVSPLSCVPGVLLCYFIVNTYLSPVHHHRVSPLSCVPGVLQYYFIVNTYLSHCTCLRRPVHLPRELAHHLTKLMEGHCARGSRPQ